MRNIRHTTLAVAVLTVFLAGANAQATSGPITTSLPPEVSAAHAQVVNDLATVVGTDVAALKAAVAKLEFNRAAGTSVTADVAAVEAAGAQLRTDQQALAAAGKAYFSADRLAIKGDQAQLKADMTAALNTAAIAADKAAVDAAEAKVKVDIAANDMAALAVDKAALDAARRQLATDRSAALASSLAVVDDSVAVAAAR
jgi:colicin import membrane protein